MLFIAVWMTSEVFNLIFIQTDLSVTYTISDVVKLLNMMQIYFVKIIVTD